jgi:putative glutamine amidotransferase
MNDDRPVIGIGSLLVDASWGVWHQRAAVMPWSFVTAVQRAGGLALVIPPDGPAAEHPDETLSLIDGLLLAGGNDLDPGCYGAEAHPATNGLVRERDDFEIALSKRAIELDMPILGICRGMQVLNVALGGTLLQHLPETFGHEEHRRTPGTFTGSDHDVRLQDESLAAEAAGERLHAAKSHHHQGVDALGDGLQVTGLSTLDDLPEAIEVPGKRYVLGVQWHPEADERSRVIGSLVSAARDYRTARGSV